MMRSVLIVACLGAGAAMAQPSMGIGILCSYSLVLGVKTYQETCRPDLEMRAAFLQPLIEKHRRFVSRNAGWDAARHAQFAADQRAHVTDCTRADLARMAETLLAEPERLIQGVDLQLAQSRKPDWGVCF